MVSQSLNKIKLGKDEPKWIKRIL